MGRVLMFDGREFEVRRTPFSVMDAIERECGVNLSAMTDAQQSAATVLATLRMHKIHVTWKEVFENPNPEQYEIREDPDPEPVVDPQTAGAEAGPVSPPDATGTGY